jgi:hypothetical protein
VVYEGLGFQSPSGDLLWGPCYFAPWGPRGADAISREERMAAAPLAATAARTDRLDPGRDRGARPGRAAWAPPPVAPRKLKRGQSHRSCFSTSGPIVSSTGLSSTTLDAYIRVFALSESTERSGKETRIDEAEAVFVLLVRAVDQLVTAASRC